MTRPTSFETGKAFRAWLKSNAASASELLVGFHKVGSGRPCMSWSESVDEALCFGSIDGVRKRIDDAANSIRFTPRKPTSIWSAVNIAKFERLRGQGLMTPAGVKAFGHRTDARSVVYAYEQEWVAELSATEERAFRSHRTARAFFAATPETRSARLARLIEACASGQRLR